MPREAVVRVTAKIPRTACDANGLAMRPVQKIKKDVYPLCAMSGFAHSIFGVTSLEAFDTHKHQWALWAGMAGQLKDGVLTAGKKLIAHL